MTDYIVDQNVTSSGITLHDGDTLTVQSGGVASAMTILNGGTETVSSGGSAAFASISSGGIDRILTGGQAAFTVVETGGTQIATGGHVDSSFIFSGGLELLSAGAVADGIRVQSGGGAVIYDGGVAAGTVISVGGAQTVSSGGVASKTVIRSGGSMTVSSGGVDHAFSLAGTETIASGGSAAAGMLTAGGTEIVAGGGVASDLTLAAGAVEIVSSGGTDQGAAVLRGAMLAITDGALLSGETFSGGGEAVFGDTHVSGITLTSTGMAALLVSSGAVAMGTVVSSGTMELVLSGGTDQGATIVSGGLLGVADDAALSGETFLGGAEAVLSGGRVTGAVLTSGGRSALLVSAGGVAVGALVSSGATETVSAGGIASGTIISSGGTEIVMSGAFDDGATVLSGGSLIFAGGTERLTDGAKVSGVTVGSGGLTTLEVSSGGTAIGITISSGGIETVLAGGVDSATTVLVGGQMIVSSGGLTLSSIVDSGRITVSSGGVASGTTLGNLGELIVLQGGVVSDVVANDLGFLYISSGAVAYDTTVNANGQEGVWAGGVASGSLVRGDEYVLSRGAAYDTTIDSGGTLEVGLTEVLGAYAVGVVVENGGTLLVAGDDNQADNVTVSQGGLAIITAEGDIQTITVDSGATLLNEGGFAFGVTALSGATVIEPGQPFVVSDRQISGLQLGFGALEKLIVASGGTAIGTSMGLATSATVSSGGTMISTILNANMSVLSGGQANGVRVGGTLDIDGGRATSIFDGGNAFIFGGGFADGVTVAAEGNLNVFDATVFDTTISGFQEFAINEIFNEIGVEDVGSGGVQAGGAVEFDGSIEVLAGGVVSDFTVDSGGVLVIDSGAVASDPVFNGGDIVLNFGGALDLSTLPYAADGTATWNQTTHSLTVSAGGQSETEQLSGDYTGLYFHISPDSNDPVGTLVTMETTPCYCRGTLILTDHGEVPVEALRIGEHVVTAAGSARPVRWIGRRSYTSRFAAASRNVLPVQFHHGSLGNGLPRRDLFVSPLHAMFLDGVLVPAAALVNGSTITQAESIDLVEYFHIELDTHDVILAEGAASETFVDDYSRGMFHNAAEYRKLYPDAVHRPARYCAPRVEDGPALEALRQRLAVEVASSSLQGHLEYVDCSEIRGWAQDESASPVRLQILDNGVVLGQVVADVYREDLEQAGIGDGRHSFTFIVPGGLSPQGRHTVEVRRVSDGQPLHRSPWLLPAQASRVA